MRYAEQIFTRAPTTATSVPAFLRQWINGDLSGTMLITVSSRPKRDGRRCLRGNRGRQNDGRR